MADRSRSSRGSGSRGGGSRGGGPRGRGDAGRGRPQPPPGAQAGVPYRSRPQQQGGQSSTENKVGNNLEQYVKDNQSKLGKEFPDRPGYGQEGSKVKLWANYFPLQVSEDLTLRKYQFEIAPVKPAPAAKGRKIERIIDIFLEDHFPQKRRGMATDYKRTLISLEDLPVKQKYTVEYRDDGADASDGTGQQYTVILQHDSEKGEKPVFISIIELLNYLRSQSTAVLYDRTAKATAIQTLNIIVGHGPKSDRDIASIGANKHFALSGNLYERADLGYGLECLRGFFVSVRPATYRILLNIQVKHAAMYKPGTVNSVVRDFTGGRKDFPPAQVHKFLARVRVELIHLARKNKSGEKVTRIKTIYGLATPRDGKDSSNPPKVPVLGAASQQVRFYIENPPQESGIPQGSFITVADYFKKVYDHTCSAAPVLNVGTHKRPVYVPPELCRIIPGQPAGVKLSPSQTKNMTDFSIRSPAANANTIVRNGPKLLGLDPLNQTLTSFKIKTNHPPNMITVPGRVLSGPSVTYRAQAKPKNIRDAGWNLNGVQFAEGTALREWAYMTLRQGNVGEKHADCLTQIQSFERAMNRSGIQASKPRWGESVNWNLEPAVREAQLTSVFRKCESQRLQMLIVILPTKDVTKDAIYKKIKAFGDVTYGVHTVCMTVSNLMKDDIGTFANIALKVNAKLGGTNHSLEAKHCSLIRQGSTMVLGIDVTHPSPGSSEDAPSVVAMVASTGPNLGQWPAELSLQEKSRQETVIKELVANMLKTRLRLWQKMNKAKLPENILVYRDGVSEGEYQATIDDELCGMQQGCKEMYPAELQKRGLPRFSVIVVGKRHHTRFYVTDEKDAQGRPKNTKPGTVVDRGVTEARNWDFFLQPHAAIQGTARPAHYCVIYDEIFRNKKLNPTNERPADMLERLTHEISYLYARATKAVSLCPAAYYADLACERARDYLVDYYDATAAATPAETESGTSGAGRDAQKSKINIHPKLKDTMFYL
ncbi:Piwi-domain-containing protein [Viridothelium virens]|uniref:Piwi-domain-containing protein n=1 Tax=Viridothelium virens TaxID=1048519 RepID=A0A6A6GSL1_VIRVR|nr:Piwi-domain-containing protein [Viridothelium virens]